MEIPARRFLRRACTGLLLGMACTVAQAQGNTPAAAGDRVALVIGNAAYKDSPLSNPVNDATDIARALEVAGFKVILRRDVGTREMRQAIRDFGAELRRAQVGLFYFAGHGVQVKGNNYLVPVGADIQSEADAEDLAIDANYALRTMEDAQAKVSIVILDACRNNPFARGFRSVSRGLAQMNAATGSLVAFATAPGSVAADGTGRNGIYTKHLLESLAQPDTDILKVFQRTRAAVVKETGGKQTPWENTSLVGDFHFRPPAQLAGIAPSAPLLLQAVPADASVNDRALWDAVKESKNPDEIRAYLSQFPAGIFAGVAQARLKASQGSQLATAAPPASAVTSSGAVRSSANSGAFDGRWEGQTDLWHIKATVENGRAKGIMRCYRAQGDKTWSDWGPTFDMPMPADGKMNVSTNPRVGWSERRIVGTFPEIAVAGQGRNLQCPDGQVSLRRVE